MPDPVAWDLAEKVALRISGREPFSESYHSQSLEPDFIEATARAEELVAQETGLRSLSGPARARVTDRAGWLRANVASFQDGSSTRCGARSTKSDRDDILSTREALSRCWPAPRSTPCCRRSRDS